MMAMHVAGRHQARQISTSSSFPRTPSFAKVSRSPAPTAPAAFAHHLFHRPTRIYPSRTQNGTPSLCPISFASPSTSSVRDALSSLRGQTRSLRTASRVRQAPQSTGSSPRTTSGSAPAVPASAVPPSPSAPAVTAAPPSWLNNLPASIKWTRPYFDLARLDKPIGSWLLYWPCGEQPRLASGSYIRRFSAADLAPSIGCQPGQSPWLHTRALSRYPAPFTSSRSSERAHSSCVVRDAPSTISGIETLTTRSRGRAFARLQQ